MKNITRFILPAISLFYIGCIKKYKFTSNACSGRFYEEVFNINPAGVDEVYLTDWLNFKIYIGKIDNEHENFSFNCIGDSIQVFKLKEEISGNKMKIVDSRTLSISELEVKKVKGKEPIFKFE
jgi:hypothetical protein